MRRPWTIAPSDSPVSHASPPPFAYLRLTCSRVVRVQQHPFQAAYHGTLEDLEASIAKLRSMRKNVDTNVTKVSR